MGDGNEQNTAGAGGDGVTRSGVSLSKAMEGETPLDGSARNTCGALVNLSERVIRLPKQTCMIKLIISKNISLLPSLWAKG